MATGTDSATRVLCAVLTAIPLLFGPLQAQAAPQLERGTHIRFSPQVLDPQLSANGSSSITRDVYMAYVRDRRVTASVLSSDADTLVVRLSKGGAQLSLPWESFEWMETKSRARTRATVISTLVGAAAVGVPLAILGAAVWEEDDPLDCNWYECRKNRWNSPTETAVQLGLRGAVVGGGIGFAIGAMGAFDRWRSVPVPARVAVVPTHDRVSLSGSVRF